MAPKLPIYTAIARDIEERIRTGLYKPGEKIPAIRQLADEFDCNKLTVQRAFGALKQQGLIENRVGSGSYVRYPQKIAVPAGAFDFQTDYLHESLFPHTQVQELFAGIFRQEKARALAPPPVAGDPDLLHVLSRTYNLPAARMLIISGAQQGLDLVSKVFGARISESILFEDPTYPGAISLFKARHFVPMEDDGPDLDALDLQLSAPIRLLYTMPAVHNPMGRAYSLEKREALARRARRHGFFIVEDDYLGELCPPDRRFVDICPECTIFVKSFAQTTLAGIRLGFMVVPKDLFERFVYAKFSSDITSFGLLQKFLRDFISQGLYADHLETVLREAADRRRRLQQVLARFPSLSFRDDQCGYSLWIRSDAQLPPTSMPWSCGEEFSFSPRFRQYFKIAFMHMPPEKFGPGLACLEKLLGSISAA